MKNIKLYPCFKHWLEYDSIWLISDTHFNDADCKYMDSNWITPEEHIQILKKVLNKQTLLIHLGDVGGNPEWLDQLKCYKVLITGNHDKPSLLRKHFNEIYTGPLFIAPKLLLSHEPIALDFCYNIHGHCHNGEQAVNALNVASNVINYEVVNLGELIKKGIFSKIDDLHRQTIDKATAIKKEKMNMSKYFKRYEEENSVEYPEDISYIRTEVESKYGTLDCSDSKLEDLWREYSDDAWCAGFMSPNEAIVESFVNWLEEQE